MFPLPWNFPFRKKDGTIVNVVDAMSGGGGGGSDLPDYDSSDAGRVLGVDENGDLEWSDKVKDLSVDVSSLDTRTDALELHSDRVDHDILVIGGSTIENWQGSGVNIINNIMKDITLQGITFTVNDDKTVRAVGTAESGFGAQVGTASLKAGITYKITDTINGVAGEATNFVAAISNGSIIFASCDTETYPATYTALTDMEVLVQIIFLPGTSVNKIYFPSIIDTSVDPGGYVVPAKSNLQLTAENQTLTNYANAQSNPNLLDNPWFTVNQRGQSSYNTNNTYTVDRWYFSEAFDLTVNADNSVTLLHKDNSNAEHLLQSFEQELVNFLQNKYVTATIELSDGTIYSYTAFVPTLTSSAYRLFDLPIGDTEFAFFVIVRTSNSYFSITSSTANASMTIKAVKLELGNVSTLASDTAPNYSLELLKCQRYFVRYLMPDNSGAPLGIGFYSSTTNARLSLTLPIEMRAKPTVNISDISKFKIIVDNVAKVTSAVSVSGVFQNIITLNFTTDTATQYAIATLNRTTQGEYIDLSADL